MSCYKARAHLHCSQKCGRWLQFEYTTADSVVHSLDHMCYVCCFACFGRFVYMKKSLQLSVHLWCAPQEATGEMSSPPAKRANPSAALPSCFGQQIFVKSVVLFYEFPGVDNTLDVDKKCAFIV